MPHDWLFPDSKVFNVTAIHLNKLTAIDSQLTLEKTVSTWEKCPLMGRYRVYSLSEARLKSIFHLDCNLLCVHNKSFFPYEIVLHIGARGSRESLQ